MPDSQETAMVVGVGPGLGGALVRCFADAGMRVAAASRDPSRHAGVVEEVASAGGTARAYACDAVVETDVDALFDAVAADLGEPDLVVYNAGAFVPKSVLDTTSEEFEQCWRVGCLGGFHVGRAALRRMVPRERGTILFTSATAALRGGARFHNLAVGKFGLRALAQSMAREFDPQGIHVGNVIVDGLILGEKHADKAGDHPPDGLLDPNEIAANYLHLHRQHRSAWTLELDLRPWVEKF